MDAVVKFTNQSQGRDRIFRATQYACALSIYLLRKNSARKDLVAKLKSLEATMSSGRKSEEDIAWVTASGDLDPSQMLNCEISVPLDAAAVQVYQSQPLHYPLNQSSSPASGTSLRKNTLFRLGNTIHSIEAARRTMQLSDRVLCLCLTVANINRALYFVCDNVVWARSVGLIRDIDKERWSLNATRCYFLSLVMNLTRDVYAVLQLMAQRARDTRFRQKMDQHLRANPEVADVVIPQLDAALFLLLESLKSQPDVALDTLKNICDLFIPLDRLGIFQSNAGVVGFCGLISSLIGIVTLAQPKLRIKP